MQGSSACHGGPMGIWSLSPEGWQGGGERGHLSVHRGRDSQFPGTSAAAGVGSALGWCWQALFCAPVCTRSLPRSVVPFSFYLFTVLLLAAPLPPPEDAPLLESFRVLLLRASGALLPAWLVPKSSFSSSSSKVSYSKRADLGCPSQGH